ncbi:MAG: hypothetical protein WAY25_05725, partial [Trichococcus flocculiformis]
YHRRLYRLLHALLHDLKTLTSFFPLGKLFGTLYAEQNDSIGPTFFRCASALQKIGQVSLTNNLSSVY